MATKPKIRVTLNLDVEVVEYFKAQGKFEERPYQPIINRILRDYIKQAPRFGFAYKAKGE